MKLRASLMLLGMAVWMPAASTTTKPKLTHTVQTRSATVGAKTGNAKLKSAAAKPAGASVAKMGAAGKAGSLRTAAYRGRARGRVRKVSAPSYQTHPDPERYQQIQQALTDRGYFKGEVNGQWNDDSSDALKRFQADQKLDNDGKINALTLRGLGLGPKHDGSTAPMSGATAAKTNAAATVPEPPPPPVPTEEPAEPPE